MIHAIKCIALVNLCTVVSIVQADEFDAHREQVLALGDLTSAPAMTDAEGFESEGNLKAIYYDSLPLGGNPTKVFAWLGLPEKRAGEVPGVVLVHGGGGTAFKNWVQQWNAHGFAAISIAVEGQTDERLPAETGEKWGKWKTHRWPGPQRVGIYHDSDKPLAEQWMYHAAADTILANSLLRSLPEVDANQVGLMGISWGGVIASTVVGIDDRFAFAIPTYGCGHLTEAQNQYGRVLGKNEFYKQVWDPMLRLGNAKMPMLWLSWPGDEHFPLNCQAASYRAAPGPRMVTLVPSLKHGHGPPWSRPESYIFAKAVVRSGNPWCRQTESAVADGSYRVSFSSNTQRQFDEALLISTTDGGATGERKWVESAADLEHEGDQWIVTATIPPGTTAWFINLKSGDLVVSSEYQENQELNAKANEAAARLENRVRMFYRADKDKDEKVTEEEYLGYFGAIYDQLDADQDGMLDANEFTNPGALKFGDADEDGKLTRDEHQAIFKRQFANLDKNQDGVLILEEL